MEFSLVLRLDGSGGGLDGGSYQSDVDGLKHGVGFDRNGEKLQGLEYVYGTFLCKLPYPMDFFRQSSVKNISFTMEMHDNSTHTAAPSLPHQSINQPANQSTDQRNPRTRNSEIMSQAPTRTTYSKGREEKGERVRYNRARYKYRGK